MKNRRKRFAVVVPVALLLAAGLTAFVSWSPHRPLDDATGSRSLIELPFRLRNSAEHDAARASRGEPYLLEIQTERAALVYYGASHDDARDRSQVADITQRWANFNPTIALCEGRATGYFVGPVCSRFGGLPEPRLVHLLAGRDGVEVFSLEPPYVDEVHALLASWTPEQVALYFILRVYWAEAGGRADDSLAEHLRRKRTDVPGLEKSLGSLADIDRVWRHDFPDQPDWRTLTSDPEGTYLNSIGDDSRRVRGEHMARLLIDLVNRGERVFAVVGSGHVIRQEWILRAALGAEPAPDQP